MRLGNDELKTRTPLQAIVQMMETMRNVHPIRISA